MKGALCGFIRNLLWIYPALCWIVPLCTEFIPHRHPRPSASVSMLNKPLATGTILHIIQYTFIHVESTSCLLALKPSYYTIIVQYKIITSRPGNNRLPCYCNLARGNTHFPRIYFPRISGLARGKHPHSAHLNLARSPTPTSATGFREPPYKPAWLRETPYTTIEVFPVVSVVLNPNYPARAGIPLRLWGLASTIRTLTNSMRPAETGPRINHSI